MVWELLISLDVFTCKTTDDSKANTLPGTKTKTKKKNSTQLGVKLPMLCMRKKQSVHSIL